jgi:sigma-54 dependent transcriptional regulator, acetoin dehydrogenase operon transcriptional activator AcoR
VLRTAAIMAEGEDVIDIDHLPEDLMHDCSPASDCETPRDAGSAATTDATPEREPARLAEWQSRLIDDTLARHRGNVSAAARELGLARNTVYRHLRQRR